MSSWGLGNTIFEITLWTWVFKYLFPKVVFFFAYIVVFWKFINFSENFKNVICNSKLKKVWFQICDLFFVLYWIHQFFDSKERDDTARSTWCNVSLKKMGFLRAKRTTWGREAPDAEKSCRATRPMRWFKIADGVRKHLQSFFGVQGRSTRRGPKGRVYGWDGWDGMDGWTEYQKCPLKIFILCVYIDKVYTYLHIS